MARKRATPGPTKARARGRPRKASVPVAVPSLASPTVSASEATATVQGAGPGTAAPPALSDQPASLQTSSTPGGGAPAPSPAAHASPPAQHQSMPDPIGSLAAAAPGQAGVLSGFGSSLVSSTLNSLKRALQQGASSNLETILTARIVDLVRSGRLAGGSQDLLNGVRDLLSPSVAGITPRSDAAAVTGSLFPVRTDPPFPPSALPATSPRNHAAGNSQSQQRPPSSSSTFPTLAPLGPTLHSVSPSSHPSRRSHLATLPQTPHEENVPPAVSDHEAQSSAAELKPRNSKRRSGGSGASETISTLAAISISDHAIPRTEPPVPRPPPIAGQMVDPWGSASMASLVMPNHAHFPAAPALQTFGPAALHGNPSGIALVSEPPPPIMAVPPSQVPSFPAAATSLASSATAAVKGEYERHLEAVQSARSSSSTAPVDDEETKRRLRAQEEQRQLEAQRRQAERLRRLDPENFDDDPEDYCADYLNDMELLQDGDGGRHSDDMQRLLQSMGEGAYRGTDALAAIYGDDAVFDVGSLPVFAHEAALRSRGLRSKLHHHQLQALQWMRHAEDRRMPEERNGEPVCLWQTRRTPLGKPYYRNVVSGRRIRSVPRLPRGGILADDMGLGKTLQVLALVLCDGMQFPREVGDSTRLIEGRDGSVASKVKGEGGTKAESAAAQSSVVKKKPQPARPSSGAKGSSARKAAPPTRIVLSDSDDDSDSDIDYEEEREALPAAVTSEKVEHGTLIVAPLSVLANWKQQVQAHCQPNTLRVLVYHGDEARDVRERKRDAFYRHDVVLTTYDTLRNEFVPIHRQRLEEDERLSMGLAPSAAEGKAKKREGGRDEDDEDEGWEAESHTTVLHSMLLRHKWRRVVLDEGHVCRNSRTLIHRAILELQTWSRWAVTGTPIVNGTSDLGSLATWIGLEPFLHNPHFWKTLIDDQISREEKSTNLTAVMKAIALRRTKRMKGPDGEPIVKLPTLEVFKHVIEMTKLEREFYRLAEETFKERVRGWIADGTISEQRPAYLWALIRLRQLACHPGLVPHNLIEQIRHVDFSKKDVAAVEGGGGGARMGEATAGELRDALRIEVLSASECPICMETLCVEDACITSCRHVFCADCIEAQLERRSACPLCRQALTPAQLTKLPESYAVAAAASSGDAEAAQQIGEGLLRDDPNFIENDRSAKLENIVQILHTIGRSDPTEKVVVFSTFSSLLRLVSRRLAKEGIPHAQYDGSMSRQEREKVLERFRRPITNASALVRAPKRPRTRDGTVEPLALPAPPPPPPTGEAKREEAGASGSGETMAVAASSAAPHAAPKPEPKASAKSSLLLAQLDVLTRQHDKDKERREAERARRAAKLAAAKRKRHEATSLHDAGAGGAGAGARGAAGEGEGEVPRVLLATTGSGSVGINLTAASCVLIVDPWWNSAAENQAMDRIHRIGQTRTCRCIRFVTTGTVEDRVLEIQQEKDERIATAFSGIRQGGAPVDLSERAGSTRHSNLATLLRALGFGQNEIRSAERAAAAGAVSHPSTWARRAGRWF